MIPLSLKYAPKSTSEIIGQDKAIQVLKNFVLNFKRQRKKGLVLYGPNGVGKTSSVYALAKELGYELLEVNASDFRDEKRLNASIGQASKQMSLFGSSKILLVDEADGIFGKQDRGGVPTLVKLIKESAFPIVLTANDPWNKKFSKLRMACEMVEFVPLGHQIVLSVLRGMCDAEGIDYEERALSSLARRAGGDVRGSIIDLQTLVEGNLFTHEQLDLLGERRRTDSVYNAILRVFKTTDAFVARMAFMDVEEDLNELLLWIDENLPKEYTKPLDLARAYEKISRADVFNGRIRKRQQWHLLATISVLLSAGVALSKDEKYSGFVKYERTKRILKLWLAKQKYAKRNAIAEKIAAKTHVSTKVALQDTLPYVRAMFKGDKGKLVDYFDFNNEEAAWLSRV